MKLRKLGSLRHSSIIVLGLGLATTLAAQPAPSPGVPDYYMSWTRDIVGGGEWSPDEFNVIFNSIDAHVEGEAYVDVDSPDGGRADPFSVTGTWDGLDTSTNINACSSTFFSRRVVFTTLPSQPTTGVFISVFTRQDGSQYVPDPFLYAWTAYPSTAVDTFSLTGADCSGPISDSGTATSFGGFPVTNAPGDIPATNAEGTHFLRDTDFVFYLDPFNLNPVLEHWHVEIFRLDSCSVEVCDGVDNDCDGQIDENFDADSDTYTTCGDVTNVRTNGLPGGDDCDDGNAAINPGAAEACNGVDEDCDGSIDEDFDTDGDTYTTCGNSTNVRTNGLPGGGDCNDSVFAVNPGATEDCNGGDDDCDGSTDEGNPGGGLQCGGPDVGECSYGLTQCHGGQIHCVGSVGPSTEQCDALDNDCDGSVDDGNPGGGTPCNTGLLGVCSAGTTSCSGGSISCSQNVEPSLEVCDTYDNDCDGVVDEGACQASLLTSLSPARVWVGLQNAADEGIRFDLAAKVYLNDIEVGSGQLVSAPGGSSGFANAKLDTIKLSLFAAVPAPSGSSLRIEILVRNACRGSGKDSGRATLWYNGQPTDHGPREDAGSRFDARVDGLKQDYFLRESAMLSTTAGSSRLSVDQDAGTRCSAFKPFGTWTIALP